MVIPLRKAKKDGEQYYRRPEVELKLKELDELTPDEQVSQLERSQPAVPFEVLVYFLRHPELALSTEHLERIFVAFHNRLEAALSRTVPDWRFDHAGYIREMIAEQVVEMIAKDWNSQEDKMAFWEANFNAALSRLRTDVLRKYGPAKKTDPLTNAEPLEHGGEEGSELRPEVDIAAIDFMNANPSILDDPDFRLRLMDAINGLPDDERRAVGLSLQGIQIDSQDPEAMTIAKALECTEKTVRNRLNRAYKNLRTALQAEDIQ